MKHGHSGVLGIFFVLLLTILIAGVLTVPEQVFAATDTIGGASGQNSLSGNYVVAFPIVPSASGSLSSIGVNWAGTQSGNVMVALYGAGTGKPVSLLTQSSSTALSISTGFQDVPVTPYSITGGTTYWIAFLLSATKGYYQSSGGSGRSYYAKTFGSFDSTWSSSSTQDTAATANMEITYSTGPPPSDFTISASPTSQSVGGGSSASSSLSLAAGGGFSGTVTLTVTSGCPASVTCSLSATTVSSYPNSVTLTVPTLITTSGTYAVLVTATSGSLIHTATFTVTVASPSTYNFNVRTGATQVLVTVSWTGTGTASVTIAGPSGTPIMYEASAAVYDRISYVSGSTTPTNIHRDTFTLSSPPTGTWNAYVSLSATTYTVTIEVS